MLSRLHTPRFGRIALLATAAVAWAAVSGCVIVVDETGDARYVSDYDDYKSSRRRIGVTLGHVDETTAAQLKLDHDRVCTIDHVYDGTPAERAGLREHDIVTHIDGQDGASIGQLRSAIRSRDVGDSIRLTVLRAGEPQEISVEIGR